MVMIFADPSTLFLQNNTKEQMQNGLGVGGCRPVQNDQRIYGNVFKRGCAEHLNEKNMKNIIFHYFSWKFRLVGLDV